MRDLNTLLTEYGNGDATRGFKLAWDDARQIPGGVNEALALVAGVQPAVSVNNLGRIYVNDEGKAYRA